MKSVGTILLLLLTGLVAFAQEVVIYPEELAKTALPDWSSVIPDIPYCIKHVGSSFDDGRGHATLTLEYRSSVYRYWEPGMESSCASVRLEFTYPYNAPPSSPLPKPTKQQLREKKKAEKRERETNKKLRKLYEQSPFMNRTLPPPRHFTFKCFPATETFVGGCDYVPCPLRTLVTVQFGRDRFLHIEAQRTLEQVEAILNRVDFEALASEITKRINMKMAEKNEKPPVAERP